MKEKFVLNPDYLKMEPDLDKMLTKADAAFITGDKAFEYSRNNSNYLDLGEEWEDLTGFPFVYAFWAGREFTVKKNELSIIKKAYELGRKNLVKICKDYAASHSESWSFYHDFLTQNMQYVLTEEAKDGLAEYYNYAFFFGFSEFIPDLHFYEL